MAIFETMVTGVAGLGAGKPGQRVTGFGSIQLGMSGAVKATRFLLWPQPMALTAACSKPSIAPVTAHNMGNLRITAIGVVGLGAGKMAQRVIGCGLIPTGMFGGLSVNRILHKALRLLQGIAIAQVQEIGLVVVKAGGLQGIELNELQ